MSVSLSMLGNEHCTSCVPVSFPDEHKEYFAATFPWIFEAQKALQPMGIQADYAELLMVSGDIWQFRFDPKGPMDQCLAAYDPAAVERLAGYYKVTVEALLKSIASAVAEGRSKGDGDVTASASLKRWKVAIASAASAKCSSASRSRGV